MGENKIYNYPDKIRILFRPSDDLARYVGFGVDTNIQSLWSVPRQDGLRIITMYPDNWRALVRTPEPGVKVSAVLCTCAGREHFIPRAIDQFRAQTWPHKELIIINQGFNWLTKEGDRINEMRVPHWLNNGAMRNIGDALATGKYIVRLDDDDLYHRDRFKMQVEAMQMTGALASSFKNIINYVLSEDAAWVRSLKCSPGLLMYENKGYRYIEDMRKSSDTYFMAEYFGGGGEVATIDNPPEYYIRLFHGINQMTSRQGLGKWDIKPGARTNGTGLPVDWDYFEERIKEFQMEVAA